MQSSRVVSFRNEVSLDRRGLDFILVTKSGAWSWLARVSDSVEDTSRSKAEQHQHSHPRERPQLCMSTGCENFLSGSSKPILSQLFLTLDSILSVYHHEASTIGAATAALGQNSYSLGVANTLQHTFPDLRPSQTNMYPGLESEMSTFFNHFRRRTNP